MTMWRVGTCALQIFVLLLALSFVHSSPVDDLSEIAPLKAEVARQRSRVRELEAEVARLRSQKGALSEQIMADLNLEEDASERSKNGACKRKIASLRRHYRQKILRTKGKCDFKALSTRTCPGRCQGKCYLTDQFDSKCRMDPRSFVQQTSNHNVQLVENSTRPQWKMRGIIGADQNGHPKYGDLGTVSCPCTEKGKLMTEAQAVRSIVGQVAALGIPDVWLKWICQKRAAGEISPVAAMWNSKVVLSAMKMLNCWKSKCSGKVQVESADAQLDQLLDGRSAAIADLQWGGGSMC